jgi:anti-sigma28 factor (negative regulator of flagellin synthesis)
MVTEKISLGAKEVCRLADEKDVKERTMKVTHKGPADADRFQLVPNASAVGGVRRDKGGRVGQTGESSIFKEARESQRIAELARQDDELRAEKVKRVKEMIAKGNMKLMQRKSPRVSFVRSLQEGAGKIFTRLQPDERNHGSMGNLLVHIREAPTQASVSLYDETFAAMSRVWDSGSSRQSVIAHEHHLNRCLESSS